jgi:hypothetical protein
MLRGLGKTQASGGQPASLSAGLSGVGSRTVESRALVALYIREQFIGYGEITRSDCPLDVSFQAGNFRIIPRLDGDRHLYCS